MGWEQDYLVHQMASHSCHLIILVIYILEKIASSISKQQVYFNASHTLNEITVLILSDLYYNSD